jgi:lipoprotein NlpI
MPRTPARKHLAHAHAHYLDREFAAADPLASAALAIDPSLVNAWALRGRIRRDAGNADAAWNDFTHALALNPACFTTRTSRACLAFDNGVTADALVDFDRALADRTASSEDYNRLRIWLCRARLGDERAASRELRLWLRASPCASTWTWAIAETLWREKRPSALLEAATNDAERCEAGFWAGERLLLNHDRPAAVRAFRLAAASPLWRFTEKRSAEAELKRLGA